MGNQKICFVPFNFHLKIFYTVRLIEVEVHPNLDMRSHDLVNVKQDHEAI